MSPTLLCCDHTEWTYYWKSSINQRNHELECQRSQNIHTAEATPANPKNGAYGGQVDMTVRRTTARDGPRCASDYAPEKANPYTRHKIRERHTHPRLVMAGSPLSSMSCFRPSNAMIYSLRCCVDGGPWSTSKVILGIRHGNCSTGRRRVMSRGGVFVMSVLWKKPIFQFALCSW